MRRKDESGGEVFNLIQSKFSLAHPILVLVMFCEERKKKRQGMEEEKHFLLGYKRNITIFKQKRKRNVNIRGFSTAKFELNFKRVF